MTNNSIPEAAKEVYFQAFPPDVKVVQLMSGDTVEISKDECIIFLNGFVSVDSQMPDKVNVLRSIRDSFADGSNNIIHTMGIISRLSNCVEFPEEDLVDILKSLVDKIKSTKKYYMLDYVLHAMACEQDMVRQGVLPPINIERREDIVSIIEALRSIEV